MNGAKLLFSIFLFILIDNNWSTVKQPEVSK